MDQEEPAVLRAARSPWKAEVFGPVDRVFSRGKRSWWASRCRTHEAEVLAVDVKRRGEITTPWPPAHPEDLCVVYTLAEVQERPRPILLEHGMPRYRWASRLSLSRAREGSQLYLETEPEWRLYDELKAKGIEFRLRAGHPEVPDPDDPRGRAVFEVGPWQIRYAGAAGFLMVKGGQAVYEPFVDRVIERIGGETEWSNLAVRGTGNALQDRSLVDGKWGVAIGAYRTSWFFCGM